MINTDQLRMQLPEEDFLELEYLHRQLEARHAGNKRRADIYDLKEKWKDLGVAIPQRFRSIEVASGWGQKAVDHLARRVRMESFTFGDPGMDDNFGISAMWEDNSMDVDMPQATTSAFIHSPGFLLTMEGETAAGEPDIVFSAHDALHATGRWNWSRRGLDSALILIDVDDSMYATGVGALNPVRRLIFFNKDRMYDCRRDERDEFDWRWDVERQDYGLGRVPVEPLLYHPRTSRPFGGSRITRSVMYLIQAAMRSMVRAELGAEFFVTPQRYGLNVSEEDLFQNGKSEWDVLIGKMLTLSTPENPDDPDPILNQFPQVSMQPHAELLRFWGTLFSGETGIPVGSLGIIQDNPSSAEAIYAAKEDLVLEAEESARMFTPAIKRTMLNGIQMRENLAEPPAELVKGLGVRWIDPSTPSKNQQVDAAMKQVAGGVLPADSEVTLEILGHNADTIRRISDDRRRAAARETIRQALAVQVNQEPGTPPQNGGETPEQGAPDNATKLSQQATPPAQAPAAE